MNKKGLFGRLRRTSSSPEDGGKRERGAALVEFAFIAPLFFLVVFGGIEIGLMFRSYLALESTSRSVARVASIERDDPMADEAVLNRIDQLVAPLQGDVTHVIIYKADALDSELPAGCETGSQVGVCTTYVVTDGDVAMGAPSGGIGWNSTTRNEFDNVGIHIIFEYTYATGFFDTLTLSSTTVEVIERNF